MYNTLYEYENSLTKEQCDKIINFFENTKELHLPGTTGAGVDITVKDSTDISIKPDFNKVSKEIDELLFKNLNKRFKQYLKFITKEFAECTEGAKTLKTEMDGLVDTGYQIQKTVKDGKYVWHHDYCPKASRYLTFIWYLNDVPPENGGATEFIGGRKIQPKMGKFIMFPATWTSFHRGCPLKKGVKYIVTGWLSFDHSKY